MNELTFAQAKSLIKADFETGRLYWLERGRELFKSPRLHEAWNKRFAGKEAFASVDGKGYRFGRLYGQAYRTHRIVWLLATGEWPSGDIDHINGDRSDNRLCNLRDISHAMNGRNAKLSKANTSGVTGVTWSKQRNRWQAQICVGGKTKNLGHFKSFDAAVQARKSSQVKFGFHANHGRSSEQNHSAK